jgi:hypothetical protein
METPMPEPLTRADLDSLLHQASFGAFCMQCGPLRYTDEDGCCQTCGSDAVGREWDLFREQISHLIAHIREQDALIRELARDIVEHPDHRWVDGTDNPGPCQAEPLGDSDAG